MRLKKDTILYAATVLTASNLILQIMGFVYRIVLSRFGGAEGLGVYHLVLSVYSVVNAGCLVGITTACSRLSAEYHATGHSRGIRRLIISAFAAFCIFFGLCAVVLLGRRHEIAVRLLGDTRTASAFLPMLLCLALTGVENIFKAVCIGLNKMPFAAASEVTEQFIRISAVAFLLYRYANGDNARLAFLIFCGMAISECFSSVFLSLCYRHDISPLVCKGKDVNRRENVSRFLTISLPLCATALCNNLIGSARSVLLPKRLVLSGLNKKQALEALGVVSGMASPLVLLPIALIGSVLIALMPAISKAYATGQKGTMRHLTERGLFTVGMIGLPSVFVIVPMSPLLSKLIFHQEIASHYLFLLGITAALMFYEMAAGSILNTTGYQRYHIATAIGSEILQLVLVFVLCAYPSLGIYGYLYAAILATGAGAGANFILLCRTTGNGIRISRVLLLPAVCATVLFFWTRIFLDVFLDYSGSNISAVVLTLMGASALYLLLLRLFNVHIWRYLKVRMDATTAIPLHFFL